MTQAIRRCCILEHGKLAYVRSWMLVSDVVCRGLENSNCLPDSVHFLIIFGNTMVHVRRHSFVFIDTEALDRGYCAGLVSHGTRKARKPEGRILCA